MKNTSLRVVTIALCISALGLSTLPAKAETICKVTDPTGTPLNVRATPNGKIINRLKNLRKVYIEQIAYDSQGRQWAKISGSYNGKYRLWGWVIREFVSCYNN